LLQKNAFLPQSDANKEALLVHIVDVPQLNVVLSDSCVEEFEVVTIGISIVSLDVVAVHPNGPFRCKFGLVACYKAGNPAS
jgi:hypothetical protein